ncbi:putative EF-hand calcium-binding domain-containing protein 11 [Blattamonas nauphoetae]|uniref:EF-hand calcium-binding domain-containing protein 11 n=1 Tax=Blattamonas nauphoetae TaxID=2049346 RepID=A0ABQ9YEI9_9EUKA|nr:putative EF-hand calcium-binding domain-containing protein 11 [Blattamonas nauphoetae]
MQASNYTVQKRSVPLHLSQRIKQNFQKYSDGPQCISKSNFKLACIATFGFKPSKPELQVIFQNSNTITETQFTRVLLDRAAYMDQEDETRKLFHLFDMSGCGYISYSDFESVANDVAPVLKKDALLRAFREADRDNDGKVSYKDFERVMTVLPLS